MLQVSGLSKSFGAIQALDRVDLQVEKGRIHGIIGPNGSGKTVLFKALIGAIPYAGSVRWAPGTRVGYVPQKLDLERDLPITGDDFLRAKASVLKSPADEVRQAIDLVNLPPAVAAMPIGTLSGGQFQRLLLAFALLGRPTVLLCDEPTAGVDEPGEEGLYATIHRLQHQQGLTLILISHELNIVYRYATSVLCLSRGRGFSGPPLEILTPERLQEVYGAPMKFHHHADDVA